MKWSGWISGDGHRTTWTKVLNYGKVKYRFYNPIKQNNSHIKALKNLHSQFKTVPFYSVIVFYGDCELKEINYVPKGTYIT
ncbi:NERD domain-containing protein [Cryomorpha ignava]|uniref:NERD domain-containing protein n=1 Tax=Cryomorpha ignava TaxID=101383 RepID=A0A7K3WU68_9FLAO|nr:nuclease-related domain-containing protein [Cryomorpha ignava]NEN25223.1 NERD domain-containing protein [Cryomorpha ignava]